MNHKSRVVNPTHLLRHYSSMKDTQNSQAYEQTKIHKSCKPTHKHICTTRERPPTDPLAVPRSTCCPKRPRHMADASEPMDSSVEATARSASTGSAQASPSSPSFVVGPVLACFFFFIDPNRKRGFQDATGMCSFVIYTRMSLNGKIFVRPYCVYSSITFGIDLSHAEKTLVSDGRRRMRKNKGCRMGTGGRCGSERRNGSRVPTALMGGVKVSYLIHAHLECRRVFSVPRLSVVVLRKIPRETEDRSITS